MFQKEFLRFDSIRESVESILARTLLPAFLKKEIAVGCPNGADPRPFTGRQATDAVFSRRAAKRTS